ncbi:sugar-binding transcriptional regulator [Guptibacillus algicola]|uniref:sugar-binding transcriptional regulator n=1 Tax=Guptibacillus algicola TaxID=225844 RepID=UPI001CD5F338|nr:sugar-binding transcriptional regulator [Alkalihalobacillus algicola]MCA0986793.1 sugar-binding transcriptional regulator [Alkalihalobacillus algicola]
MRSLLALQQKLLPDLLEVMNKRYRVLRQLRLTQPIGRRSLANSLDITERVLRSEVTFLKDQGLIDMSIQGMQLTEEGEQLLMELEPVMNEVSGLDNLEERLKDKLGIPEVLIVPGDSDVTPWVKKEMGRAAVGRLKRFQLQSKVIAVTGGTTLASVADMMIPSQDTDGTLFVPARGGLGEQVENQANTICAKMARKAHTDYRLLHVPDQLSEEAYQSLIEEPGVKEILEIIKSASIVVHGIGDAKTMAVRRKSTTEVLEKIEENQAVAEAFGYYFNQSGDVVHKVKTIGLQLEDLERSELVIAVAGGHSKANAIEAYLKTGIQSTLVTDEGAAKALLEGFSL